MDKLTTFLLVCGMIAAATALPSPKNKSRFFGTLIVGGEPATQGELPYQIDLRLNGRHYCGGSLVTDRGKQFVVTAAHCIEGYNAADFTVVAGDLSQSETSGREQSRQVASVHMHVDYGQIGYEDDIALVFYNETFELNADVQPIALPEQLQQTTGDIIVSGWGTLSSGGQTPDILQKVQIPIVPDAECQAAYANEYMIESMLCAGLPQGGKDSCQGDSGGPLKAVNGGYLAGIVSWGYGCAAAGYPGVNTEVAYFINWMRSHEKFNPL